MVEELEKVPNNLIPNFKTDLVPSIKLKSIRLENFKTFKDYTFDFSGDSNDIKNFICLIGPNGFGKSTVLSAIQLLFSNLNFRTNESKDAYLSKSIRHVNKTVNSEEDFKITAILALEKEEYEVIINKSGFVKDHPQEIKELAYRICYLAKFDQDLSKFQIARSKWGIFKELFEAVTGFEIEENKEISDFFSNSSDSNLKMLMKEFVLAFYVKKPLGIIQHKECSDGEKKIIKAFSTVLTLEYTPKIILIDNVEMHVERGRHLRLIESLKKCFPESQIITTTHSYYISRGFGIKSCVYDLRLISANKIIRKQPWRLCIMDEINEAIIRLEAIDPNLKIIKDGKKLLRLCSFYIKDLQSFRSDLAKFLKESLKIFIKSMLP